MSQLAVITLLSTMVLLASGVVAILGWGASQEAEHSDTWQQQD